MHSTESTLAVFPEELYFALKQLDVAGQGMLLAVSGGSDSMALLHAMIQIRHQLGVTGIEVAHLNHGLRGSSSDDDAAFVRAVCHDHQLPCHIETLAPEVLRNASRGSLEEAARTTRYRFLQGVALQRNLANIATAHHRDDQIETILFSLLRGTGLRGLHGISATRQLTQGIRLIRPMLSISKESLQRWLFENTLGYQLDESNDSGEFARNRIRKLISALPKKERHILSEKFWELSLQADQTIMVLDEAAAIIHQASVLDTSASLIRLRRTAFLRWPEPLVRHALTVLWSTNHWPLQGMTRKHWLQISQLLIDGSPKRWMFPGGIQLQIRRDIALLTRRSDSAIKNDRV